MKIKYSDEIICEFLRTEVKEPTRVGYTKRHTTASQSFSGNGVLTEFTITNTKLLCINSVVVDSITQEKYRHFDIDLDNNKIIFKTAPANGTNNIVVSYDYNTTGASWIFPDKPREDLGKSSYPRISIVTLSEPGNIMGFNEDDTIDTATLQIDIISYKDLKCTIETETKEGQDVCNYIGYQVKNKIFTERNKIRSVLWFPTLLENNPIPFDEEFNIFRRTQTYSFRGINIGE